MKTYKQPALGKFERVENYGGVVNQFVLHFEKGIVFQSYSSVIVVQAFGKGTFLGQDWNYSKTTSKYRNMFLNETSDEIKAKFNNGEYKLLKD